MAQATALSTSERMNSIPTRCTFSGAHPPRRRSMCKAHVPTPRHPALHVLWFDNTRCARARRYAKGGGWGLCMRGSDGVNYLVRAAEIDGEEWGMRGPRVRICRGLPPPTHLLPRAAGQLAHKGTAPHP